MTTPRRTFAAAWLISLLVIVVSDWIDDSLGRWDLWLPGIDLLSFLAWLVFVPTSIFWFAVFIRYVLRKLFWKVGRRLALSYFLIGFLPFFFFAILMTAIGYAAAGLLAQTAFRLERHATLTRLSQANLEYAHTRTKPHDALSTLEVYDSQTGSDTKLPDWLRERAFSGLVSRGKDILFVVSRVYSGKEPRTIALVQPYDDAWAKALELRNGTVLVPMRRQDGGRIDFKNNSRRERKNRGAERGEIDVIDLDRIFKRTVRTQVWFDASEPLTEWKTGVADPDDQVVTWLSTPWPELVHFYAGQRSYLPQIMSAILGLAAFLTVAYLLASLLTLTLIFSISRAVNRIQKGTKAVESGDFSYRIGLKPRSQLGEVAVSFDRMTNSISGLMRRVAEQERLQSEIDIAASIQRNLLPKEGPQLRGVSFAAHFEPTASIGGDYYDVFRLDESRLAAAIGDVSGHGLSTGIVMAMVKAAMTTLVEEGADEVALFRRLNELVHRSTDKRAFMTLGFTIFDLDRATLRHTNAGHLYPYVLRSGEAPMPIEVPSLPLGLRPQIDTITVELPLAEADTVVYLSDGIVEAADKDGEPFGFEKLESLLVKLSGSSPAEIQSGILDAVSRHSAGELAQDDRTIMILRFDQVRGIVG